MTPSFVCPHCQAPNTWPAYSEGKEVTCPGCRKRFIARAAREESAPLLDEDPPMVLPVEEEAPPRTTNTRRRRHDIGGGPHLDCVQAIYDECERRDLQHLAAPRRLLFALLVASLEQLRPNLIYWLFALMLMPAVVVFGIGVGFAMMGVFHLIAIAMAAIGFEYGHGLLYLLPGFVILSAYYTKQSAKIEAVSLVKDGDGKAMRIKLGRLEGIFQFGVPATSLLYFGALLASQVSLLYFLPNHLGVAEDGTFVECVLLTLDNLCHGVLMDTFEIYNINLAGKVEHDWWSGTVFYFFRISYEAFLLIAAYQLWRGYSMRRLFRRLPTHWRNVEFVLEWIEHASRTEGDWAREFLDEFLFLILAGAYISDDDEMLRDINRRFPWLRINEEVRRLFIDSRGKRLFEHVAQAQ